MRAIPAPAAPVDGVLQLLVANLDYNDYVGRLAIGRIFSGTVAVGDQVSICKRDGSIERTKVTKLYAFEGLKQTPIDCANAGEIVALAGMRTDDTNHLRVGRNRFVGGLLIGIERGVPFGELGFAVICPFGV